MARILDQRPLLRFLDCPPVWVASRELGWPVLTETWCRMEQGSSKGIANPRPTSLNKRTGTPDPNGISFIEIQGADRGLV